tara:strand:- start:6656 stop:7303 length:648 start_codon:yes stop_codon:yes gene_type:complete
MITDNWIPAEEDIEWTREHYEKMSMGDTWGVADAVLRKDEDNILTVLKASPASLLPLERIKKVCALIGVDMIADDAELIQDPQAAAQAAAEEWTSPNTGIPLVNFDLENAEWVLLDPDEESWRVAIRHHDEGDTDEVALSPMDYHLLAGDELFFTWDNMRVLERHEIIDMADEGDIVRALENDTVVIMPSVWKEKPVPPHLRGLIFNTKGIEEEE